MKTTHRSVTSAPLEASALMGIPLARFTLVTGIGLALMTCAIGSASAYYTQPATISEISKNQNSSTTGGGSTGGGSTGGGSTGGGSTGGGSTGGGSTGGGSTGGGNNNTQQTIITIKGSNPSGITVDPGPNETIIYQDENGNPTAPPTFGPAPKGAQPGVRGEAPSVGGPTVAAAKGFGTGSGLSVASRSAAFSGAIAGSSPEPSGVFTLGLLGLGILLRRSR